jgi:prepilin-type N-terminal cleavage/methylation domain-containing protein
MPDHVRAFTLVELLVVITIIVVLLAILTPALNQAIYQAELVSCASGQRTIANAAIVYAFDNRRYYPTRGDMRGAGDVRAYLTPIAVTNGRANWDMRPMIRTMGLDVNKHLQCPFVQPLDLQDTIPNESAHGNQAMWFGWYYTGGGGLGEEVTRGFAGNQNLPGMFKVGDRFQAHDVHDRGKVRSFSLLVSDFDLSRPWDAVGPNAQASHPDQKHMWNWPARREQVFDSMVTISYWQSVPGAPGIRGTLDNNFGYDDGSVRRVNDIELNDSEMARIPNTQSEDENRQGYASEGIGHGYQVPRN